MAYARAFTLTVLCAVVIYALTENIWLAGLTGVIGGFTHAHTGR